MKATAIYGYTTATSSTVQTKRLPNVNPNYVPTYSQEASSGSKGLIRRAIQALNALTTNTFNPAGLEIEYDITTGA